MLSRNMAEVIEKVRICTLTLGITLSHKMIGQYSKMRKRLVPN